MFRKSIFAATLMFTAISFIAPALADGYRHGHRGGQGHYYRYKDYRNDRAAVFAGGLLLGALLGHLAAPPRTVYMAPPQPVLGNCRPIHGMGYVNGRPAEYSGTGCYDAYGNLYAMPGSERFLGYTD